MNWRCALLAGTRWSTPAFSVTSLLFWFPVIQPWPSVSRGSRWAMLPYLVGADLVNTALAAFLTFAGRVIYPSYAAGPRVFGISALGDQVAAGALMWVIGSIFYLVPLVVIAHPSALAAISSRCRRYFASLAGKHRSPAAKALRLAAAAPDRHVCCAGATAAWRCRASPSPPRSW